MAKQTYVYRVLIGRDNNVEHEHFCYARNAGVLLDFLKEKYREQKYNYYQAIKVGISHTLKDTMIIDGSEAEQLKNSIASKGDKYSERRVEAPKFIPVEEAGELKV